MSTIRRRATIRGVAAIAERPTGRAEQAPALLELVPDSVDVVDAGPLALPPGRVPVDPVYAAIRRYRARIGAAQHPGAVAELGEQLIAMVDRHGDALEREIARKAVQHMAEFRRTIDRAELLASYVDQRLAQLDWLKSFPAGPARESTPLSCQVGGRQVEVLRMLSALRTVELDARAMQLDPHVQHLDGRRGAAPSMAALADAGVSTTDVALELGLGRGSRKAWAILNGHQRAPPELQQALERLVGVDQAAVVLAGIPQHPRAHAPASRAVEALHAAGATVLDVAPLIPVAPSTVRKWLRGALRPSPKSAAALAGALEQLLGAGPAADVVALIPERPRARSPT